MNNAGRAVIRISLQVCSIAGGIVLGLYVAMFLVGLLAAPELLARLF